MHNRLDYFRSEGGYDFMGLVFCFKETWMLGAAASAAYINEAATVLPKAIMAKARAYLAGAYTDVIEV